MRRQSRGIAAVVVAAVVAFMLVSQQQLFAQGAKQPSVQREVQVGAPGGSPAPAAAPAGAPAAAPGAAPAAAPAADLGAPPVKRVLRRNPFVPPTGGGGGNVSGGPSKPAVGPTGPPKPVKTKAPEKAPEPPAPAPTFALVGIMTSGGYVRALLVTSKGAQEARVGDKIDGYTISHIDLNSREVVAEMGKSKFKVGLPQDTPYGTAVAKPGSGGAPGGAPPGGPGPLPPPPPPSGGGK